ncbi:MAG: DUF1178 family protein [Brevirhabdus sp.]
MIRYALKCREGHGFDSWFESAEAFDTLATRALVTCPLCGSSEVQKAIMAPGVSTSGERSGEALTETTPMEDAITKIKAHVEENSEYVGSDFARAARDMHEGIEPERSIHGEAKPEEARKLIEDGVPVAPLPFAPTRKVN